MAQLSPSLFPSSFYVALGRVKEGNKVYLREYQKDYIIVHEEVERKMESMQKFKKYRTFKTYLDEQIYVHKNEEVKIGYLNINGLTHAHHGEYLNEDKNLLNLDIIALSETKLKNEANGQLAALLSNWVMLIRQDSNDNELHMGMLILVSKKSKLNEDKIVLKENKIWSKNVNNKILNHMQLMTIKIKDSLLNISFLYIRKTPDNEDITRIRKYTLGSEVVMGDFNLNKNNVSEKKLLDKLCNDGKTNHLDDVTTDKLNQLDYIILDEKIVKDAFSTAFKNLITDHKSVTVRIPHIGNEFSEEFKSKFYFDADHHLKENKKKNTARRMDDKTGDFELSSLDSPNWISDEAIDNYFELIKSKFTKFFAFSTGFFACLKKEGYDGVKEWYREISIFKYKKIFFPIYDKGHHYLVVFDNSNHKIEAYDPFDFQSYDNELQAKMETENKCYLEETLFIYC